MNSRWLTIGLTILLVFIFGLVIKGLPEKVEISRQLNDLKAKIAALKKSQLRDAGLSEYFKTQGYLEKQARIRLNLKKEGEEVVFVYRKDADENVDVNADKNAKESLLSKIKEWFRIFWSRE